MPTTSFTIVKEPKDDAYRGLLRALSVLCSTALLVVRDELGLEPKGAELLEQMRGCSGFARRSASWPGTVLWDHEATIIGFSLDEKTIEILGRAASGLFDWLQPGLPEDLCFLRAEGTPLLTSIAHERDAYLELQDGELELLQRRWPELLGLLAKADSQ